MTFSLIRGVFFDVAAPYFFTFGYLVKIQGYILDLKRNHPYSKQYILKDATRSVDQIEVREKAIKIEMHDPEQITPTSYSYEYVNMDLKKKELFIRKTQSANFNWYILIHLPKIALLEKDILRVQMSCKKVK